MVHCFLVFWWFKNVLQDYFKEFRVAATNDAIMIKKLSRWPYFRMRCPVNTESSCPITFSKSWIVHRSSSSMISFTYFNSNVTVRFYLQFSCHHNDPIRITLRCIIHALSAHSPVSSSVEICWLNETRRLCRSGWLNVIDSKLFINATGGGYQSPLLRRVSDLNGITGLTHLFVCLGYYRTRLDLNSIKRKYLRYKFDFWTNVQKLTRDCTYPFWIIMFFAWWNIFTWLFSIPIPMWMKHSNLYLFIFRCRRPPFNWLSSCGKETAPVLFPWKLSCG